MRKSKAVTFALVLFVISGVLWWFFDLGLLRVVVADVILVLVVGASRLIWRKFGDDGSGSYTEPPISYYSPRLEEPARRPVQSHWPARENINKSNDRQLEAVVSWLESVDHRLGRIEAHLTRLQDGPRTTPSTFAEQPPQTKRHRSEEVASRAIDSSYTQKSDFVQFACQTYRKLAREGLRDLPLEPVFVVLDIDSSAQTSAIEEVRRNFRQATTKQSEFIVFQKNSTEAWLFPNPRISFTEAMKYVFPYLTYENFEGVTDSIAPERVRQTSPDTWEMVTDGR